jgi:hypothetical protein
MSVYSRCMSVKLYIDTGTWNVMHALRLHLNHLHNLFFIAKEKKFNLAASRRMSMHYPGGGISVTRTCA